MIHSNNTSDEIFGRYNFQKASFIQIQLIKIDLLHNNKCSFEHKCVHFLTNNMNGLFLNCVFIGLIY